MVQQYPVKGVILDVDGTLVNTPCDFHVIRQALAIEPGVLEDLAQVPVVDRKKKYRILEHYETMAAHNSMLYDGACLLMDFLKYHGIKKAVVTRNSRKSWNIYAKKLQLSFDAVVTRDDAEPQPSSAPFILVSKLLGIEPQYILSAGDFKYELDGSKNAGMRTVLVLHDHNQQPDVIELSDFVVKNLHELRELIEKSI